MIHHPPHPRRHAISLSVATAQAMPLLVAEVHHHGDSKAVAHPARRPKTWTIELRAPSRDHAAQIVETALGRAGVGAQIALL